MRMLIKIGLIMLASIGLGFLMYSDPGYILIAFHHTSIEMSVWVGLAVGIVLFIAFSMSFRFLRHVLHLHHLYRGWQNTRSRAVSHRLTREGLTALIEKRYESAIKKLIKAIPAAEDPVANYLGAARAAQALKQFKHRDNYLAKAMRLAGKNNEVVLFTQAHLQLKSKQWLEAYTLLMPFNQQCLNNHAVLKLLLKAASHLGFDKVQHVWHSMNIMLQLWPDLLLLYAKALVRHQRFDPHLDVLIERILKKEWAPELLHYYALTGARAHHVKYAEKWLRYYSKDPELLASLGRICYQQKLWGKAEQYLRAAIGQRPTASTFQWLARVQEALGQHDQAVETYQQGLSRVA